MSFKLMEEREQRAAAGFHNAENVKELSQRIMLIELDVRRACEEAARLREQVRPFRQIASVVQQWAAKKKKR